MMLRDAVALLGMALGMSLMVNQPQAAALSGPKVHDVMLPASLTTATDIVPPVYHPQRLQTIQPSVTVVGTVITTPMRQHDGDVTFEVQAASQTYHAEIVCVFPPTFAAARAACAGYTNRIAIPHRGDRVRITGPLVRDLRHDEQFHELEIHPVTALTIV